MRCFLAISFVLFVCLVAFAQGWEWLNPLPQGNTLYDIDYLGQDQLFSTSYYGNSIASTDGGTTWALRNSGVFACPSEADFASPTVGWGIVNPYAHFYADSLASSILRTMDGGQTWQVKYSNPALSFYGVDCPSAQNCWVVGIVDSSYQLAIIHTNDGGQTWSELISDSITSKARLSFLNDQEGWIAIERSIYHTIDGGATWQILPCPYWMYFDLLFVDSQNGWGASFNDLYQTTNGGQTWIHQNLPGVNNNWLMSVAVADFNHVWVVGGAGSLYHTTNGGQTWAKTVLDSTNGFNKIIFADAQHGWLCGGGGDVYQTVNGGTTWTRRTGDVLTNHAFSFSGISFADQQNGWISCYGSQSSAPILHTTDGGTTWALQFVDTSANYWLDIKAVSATNIWEVGDRVLHSTDGGLTWNPVNVGGTYGYYRIICVGEQVIWIASGSDFGLQVIRSTDGGATWDAHDVPEACKFSDMAAADANNVWITSWEDLDYCGLTHSSDGGVTWESQADTLYSEGAVYFFDALHGWATSWPGLIRTTDGGATWTTCGVPDYTSVYRIQFLDPLNGWIGGYGPTYHTTDGGVTWQRFETGYEGSTNAMSFVDAAHGWLAGGYTLLRFDGTIFHAPTPPTAHPQLFTLLPAYPNPFNSETTLSFDVPIAARVSLEVFDITGRHVQTLTDQLYTAGHHVVHFDASHLSSGIYFARATSGSVHSVQKIVLLK